MDKVAAAPRPTHSLPPRERNESHGMLGCDSLVDVPSVEPPPAPVPRDGPAGQPFGAAASLQQAADKGIVSPGEQQPQRHRSVKPDKKRPPTGKQRASVPAQNAGRAVKPGRSAGGVQPAWLPLPSPLGFNDFNSAPMPVLPSVHTDPRGAPPGFVFITGLVPTSVGQVLQRHVVSLALGHDVALWSTQAPPQFLDSATGQPSFDAPWPSPEQTADRGGLLDESRPERAAHATSPFGAGAAPADGAANWPQRPASGGDAGFSDAAPPPYHSNWMAGAGMERLVSDGDAWVSRALAPDVSAAKTQQNASARRERTDATVGTPRFGAPPASDLGVGSAGQVVKKKRVRTKVASSGKRGRGSSDAALRALLGQASSQELPHSTGLAASGAPSYAPSLAALAASATFARGSFLPMYSEMVASGRALAGEALVVKRRRRPSNKGSRDPKSSKVDAPVAQAPADAAQAADGHGARETDSVSVLKVCGNCLYCRLGRGA